MSAEEEPSRQVVDTARGPVPVADLGITLAHEHLFVLSTEFQRNYPGLWDEDRGVRAAADELNRAHALGLRTIVDMTVLGQGRDVGLVGRVAALTPVNIVLATGVYSVDGIPLFARFRGPGCVVDTDDPLVDLLTSDITDGIAGSGIRASVVKFACESTPVDAAARRMAAVVAEVHRRTAVPVAVHCDPLAGNGRELVELVTAEGVPADRVVVAHAGDSGDVRLLRDLAETGCFLGYDRYGMTTFASDEQRDATLTALVKAGHVAQLLVSQDHATHIDYLTVEQRERLYPSWSYVHLFENILPRLVRRNGLTEETIQTLLVENPKRLLGAAAGNSRKPSMENTDVNANA